MENNKMMEYLGSAYSENPVISYCRYWLSPASPRESNDLDCLYMEGDSRADTLCSPFSWLKWCLSVLNPGSEIRFSKRRDFLELLEKDVDHFLPPGNELTGLLYSFLGLAMLRCNVILLPDRRMNCSRYMLDGVTLFDLVPCTLYYLFEKNKLGRYFVQETPESWVRREKLECGFRDGIIDQEHVRPLTASLNPSESRRLNEPGELKEALCYMIDLLEQRQLAMQ